MKKDIKLILSPSTVSRSYALKYINKESIPRMQNGEILEERYMTNRCFPCIFCGERKSTKFYDFSSDKKSMLKEKFNFDVDSFGSEYKKGLSIEEKEYKKPFSKDTWYVKEYHCLTCGAIYTSRPYRKDHYVKLK